jgi:hypothetical protein
MALIFCDGFGLWTTGAATNGSQLIKGWAVGGTNGSATARQAGRYAGSYSMLLTSGGSAVWNLNQNLSLTGATSIIGFGYKPAAASNTVFYFFGGSSNCVALFTTATPEYNLRLQTPSPNGGPTGTSLFTSSTGGQSTTAFAYLEVKVVWAATTGQVVFRLNGTVLYDSGPTLSLGAGNATYVQLGGFASFNQQSYSDLIVMDGSGSSFNDFQGDLRIEPLFPKADGANTGLTTMGTSLLPSTNVSRIATDATGWTNIARVTSNPFDPVKFPAYAQVATTQIAVSQPSGASGFAVTAGHTLGLSGYCALTGAGGIHVDLRFFDSGGTQVGSDVNVTGNIGTTTWATFFGTATVPAGASRASVLVNNIGGSNALFTGITVVDGSISAFQYIEPGTAHYPAVTEASSDSDGSYVLTNTLNAKDSYQLNSLVSTSGAILGVVSTLMARKDSATTRVLTPIVRVSGTDYSGVSTLTLPGSLAYAASENVWPTSPATSSAWTRSEINAMELGAQLTT